MVNADEEGDLLHSTLVCSLPPAEDPHCFILMRPPSHFMKLFTLT